MAKYGIVETTLFEYPQNYSMRATVPVENGALVSRGDLIDGNAFPNYIYEAALAATTDEVYLVAQPAWDADTTSSVNQNEENFINDAGVTFRTYRLRPYENKFAISDYSIVPIAGTPLAKGQYVTAQAGTGKMVASLTAPSGVAFVGIIERVEVRGFTVAVGGAAIDNTLTMVTINVIQNAAVSA